MASSWRRWLGLVLILSLGWARADGVRGLILIYDARDPQSVKLQLRFMEQLTALRSSGHFLATPSLSTQFSTANLKLSEDAQLVKGLGLDAHVPLPYLALVSLDKGKPQRLIWGERVEDVQRSLDDLDTHLGLGVVGSSQGPLLTREPWTTFRCPDGSFWVDIPQPPNPLAQPPAHLWISGVKGQYAYVFGYAPIPGPAGTPDQASATLQKYADDYLRSSGITEISRKEVQVAGCPGLDLLGTQGTTRVRTILSLSAPEHRSYLLVGLGSVDWERFFTGFHLGRAEADPKKD